jgi:CubicO group peptidase (beta-lactamase class C family)
MSFPAMKTVKKIVVALILFLCSQQYSIAQGSRIVTDLDNYLWTLTNLRNFNGNVILAKNDSVFFRKTYNIPKGPPELFVTDSSKFIIASVSKIFIRYSILKLAEQQRLNLNDTIGKFIPGYPNGNKITVAHLLEHRSGLPRELRDADKYENISLEQSVELSKSESLQFEPGTQVLYSNVGFSLLHYIIEKASPEGYRKYIEKTLLIPYKLTNTGEFNFNPDVTNLAPGFQLEEDTIKFASKLSVSKNETGNYYSTAEDLFSFSRQLLSGKHMKKTFAMKMFDKDGLITQAGGRPGYRAYFHKNLNTGLTFIFVSNYSEIQVQKVVTDVIDIAMGKTVTMPKKLQRSTVAVPRETLEKYAGTYALKADMNQKFVVKAAENALVIYFNGGEKINAYPDSQTTFFLTSESTDGFEFKADPSGTQFELEVISDGMRMKTKRVE